jgi:hypothetical protein
VIEIAKVDFSAIVDPGRESAKAAAIAATPAGKPSTSAIRRA